MPLDFLMQYAINKNVMIIETALFGTAVGFRYKSVGAVVVGWLQSHLNKRPTGRKSDPLFKGVGKTDTLFVIWLANIPPITTDDEERRIAVC